MNKKLHKSLNKNIFKQKVFFTFLITIFCSLSSNKIFSKPVDDNNKLQQIRSRELQQLVIADQLDRKKGLNVLSKGSLTIFKRDLARRKRVGEIFGEGCLRTPEDYLAAALIYQHGSTPDHYYQAYIWAKKATELGSHKGREMAALAIDRYLISMGKKQLFGSQFIIKELSLNRQCFCIQDIEPAFPDRLREKYSGFTLKKRYNLYLKYVKMPVCQEKCEILKHTSRGSVPGIW